MTLTQHHQHLLAKIQSQEQVPTATSINLNTYLGNAHPKYAITTPALRKIAREWMKETTAMSADQFLKLLDRLIKAPSFTEKLLAGILLNYAKPQQTDFAPDVFDRWLDHLQGWAETDALCTGPFTVKALPARWELWDKLLTKLVKDPQVEKRRASLVFLCSATRRSENDKMLKRALMNIDALKHERDILITKAISWLLRSLIKKYPEQVHAYVQNNLDSLPPIAIRETMTKLSTGTKTPLRKVRKTNSKQRRT